MKMNRQEVEAGVPQSVLDAYEDFRGGVSQRTGTGLINQTFLATSQDGQKRAIFQRLHQAFSPRVNEDIRHVTDHLAQKGMTTPRLLEATSGQLWVQDEMGGIWRALSFVRGKCFDRLQSAQQAQSAGHLVGQFHLALADFQTPFVHVREGVHDLNKHLKTLADALQNHSDHRLFSQVEPLAQELFQRAQRLPQFEAFADRNVHGDLKISNLMFHETGETGLCLIDLDTMGRQKWAFEMGDAMRSWCNPLGENVAEAALDVTLFQAAVRGYFQALKGTDFLSQDEAQSLPDGLAYICLELTSRFLADALNESYFGFDATRFASRGEHNLLRACGQWTLFQDVVAKVDQLKALVASALA